MRPTKRIPVRMHRQRAPQKAESVKNRRFLVLTETESVPSITEVASELGINWALPRSKVVHATCACAKWKRNEKEIAYIWSLRKARHIQAIQMGFRFVLRCFKCYSWCLKGGNAGFIAETVGTLFVDLFHIHSQSIDINLVVPDDLCMCMCMCICVLACVYVCDYICTHTDP